MKIFELINNLSTKLFWMYILGEMPKKDQAKKKF